MAVLSWGKPAIYVKDLDALGAKWKKLPDAAQDTVTLETTKGDKTEAKLEGGENEDVKFARNTYALNAGIRAAKDRQKPIPDEDGIVSKNYAVALVPEDKENTGFYIRKSKVSIEDVWSAADGGQWNYTFDALKPEEGKQLEWGVVSATASGSDGEYNLTFKADGSSEAISI